MNILLVQYKEEWYQAQPDVDISPLAVSYFDKVIKIKDNKWTIIKDRYGLTNDGAVTPMMQVKLFTMGQTLTDLPTYYVDIPNSVSVLAVHLVHDKRGNLKLVPTTFNEAS